MGLDRSSAVPYGAVARGREDDAGAFSGTVASHAFLFEFGRVDNLPGPYFEDRAEAGESFAFLGCEHPVFHGRAPSCGWYRFRFSRETGTCVRNMGSASVT